MHALIDKPYFGEALQFGWRVLWRMLREHWWLYVLLAVVGVLATLASTSLRHFSPAPIHILAIFPALAATTRLANPAFRMRPSNALSVAVYALVLIYGFSTLVSTLSILRAVTPWASLAILVLVPPGLWITVRLALTPAAYTLGNGVRSIVACTGDSWRVAHGEMWWRIFTLQLCISIVGYALPGFICLQLWKALAPHDFIIATVIASLVFYAGAIPAQVWITAGLVALTSATLPPAQAEETRNEDDDKP